MKAQTEYSHTRFKNMEYGQEQIKETNCRICLKKDGIEASHEISGHVVHELFGIKIDPESFIDMFIPKFVCHSCKTDLNVVFAFKTKIQKIQGHSKYFMPVEEMIPFAAAEEAKRGKAKGQNFTCNECGKSFKYKSKFHEHIKVHVKDEPFESRYREALFAYQDRLKIHEPRPDEGEKHFKCPICNKRFSQKANLERHEMVHTGVKPHKCNICDLKFSQSNNLKRHMQTQHMQQKTDLHWE